MTWSSQLAADIDDSTTTLRLTTPLTPRKHSNFLTIGDEVIEVRGGADTIFVLRGVMGTDPVAHAAGAAVSRYGAVEFVHAHTEGTAIGTAVHPNLAAHSALGLASSSDLTTHANAADPHTGYALDADLVNHEAAAL